MEKAIGPIQKTLEANLDLNYGLTLTQFKQETLFATVVERMGRGSHLRPPRKNNPSSGS